MGLATATIADAEEYRQVLRTSRPVFLLFVSAHCPACASAVSLFEMIASQYLGVVSLVLDCANTPRHPEVTGTPTWLIYVHAELKEKHRGLGPMEDQASFVEGTFKRYGRRKRTTPPESPGAPQPPRQSSASLHAPGYRLPPASDPAGSSLNPPTSGSPASRLP